MPAGGSATTQEGWWKSATVRDHVVAGGGPFVWTDDEVDKVGGTGVDELRAAGLVISTQSRIGLTLDDVARIEAYARAHA